jgi:hypothetical protein
LPSTAARPSLGLKAWLISLQETHRVGYVDWAERVGDAGECNRFLGCPGAAEDTKESATVSPPCKDRRRKTFPERK